MINTKFKMAVIQESAYVEMEGMYLGTDAQGAANKLLMFSSLTRWWLPGWVLVLFFTLFT